MMEHADNLDGVMTESVEDGKREAGHGQPPQATQVCVSSRPLSAQAGEAEQAPEGPVELVKEARRQFDRVLCEKGGLFLHVQARPFAKDNFRHGAGAVVS